MLACLEYENVNITEICVCASVPSCLECENVNIILRYASVLARLRALNAKM